MLLRPEPSSALAPFVARMWAADDVPGAAAVVVRERVLPSGLSHLAFRLHGPPVVVYDRPEDLEGAVIGHAVVGGPRARPYLRDAVTPAISVGAQLRAGAAERIFGVSAETLAERHLPLAALWGRDADRLLDALVRARTAAHRLHLLTRALERRLAQRAPGHTAGAGPWTVQEALVRVDASADVAVRALAGRLSPRHFTAVFARAVGLTPKRFVRVRRFQSALARLAAAAPGASLAALALEEGYADQAHFTREFVAFTGLSPSRYRALAPEHRGHLPLRISSRRSAGDASSSGA